MTNFPLACVADTKIFIDLDRKTLLEAAFELPWQWSVPDLVINELQQTLSEAKWLKYPIQSVSLSGGDLGIVAQLREAHKRVSVAELSALVLAKNRGLILLAGEENLHQLAQKQGVLSHEMLWIQEKIIRLGTHRSYSQRFRSQQYRAQVTTKQRLWLSQSTASDSNNSRSMRHW